MKFSISYIVLSAKDCQDDSSVNDDTIMRPSYIGRITHLALSYVRPSSVSDFRTGS